MKLYSICTSRATVLRDEWFLKTLQDDWEIHITDIGDIPQEKRDQATYDWYYCLNKKIAILLEAINSNWGDIILWADMDIQFFRPCTDMINQCMQGQDIVFQLWTKSGSQVNPGFMAVRCNQSIRAFFETVAATPFCHRAFADQDAINDLLKSGTPQIRWGLFPREVYQITLGLVPKSIALHHACATPPPCIRNGKNMTAIDHKIEQFTMIRQYVEYPWWRKILFRVKELLKRTLRR